MFSFAKIKAVWATASAVEPMLEGVIQQAESLFPAGTKGSEKLAHVKQVLSAAWAAAGGVVTDIENAWPVLESLITAIVVRLNAMGVFNHAIAVASNKISQMGA